MNNHLKKQTVMKARIESIDKEDSYQDEANRLIGRIGTAQYGVSKDGWYEGPFKLDRKIKLDGVRTAYLYFYKVKLHVFS